MATTERSGDDHPSTNIEGAKEEQRDGVDAVGKAHCRNSNTAQATNNDLVHKREPQHEHELKAHRNGDAGNL
jgi:hypothetical protein